MQSQSPLNIVLDVQPEKVQACADMLSDIKAHADDNPLLPFGQLKHVHFARLVLLPTANHRVGRRFGAKLILATNYDGDYWAHLSDIVNTGGSGLIKLLACCTDTNLDNSRAVHEFLDTHRHQVNAFYVNTIGRSVEQVRLEERLHDSLQAHLDAHDYASDSEAQVYQSLVEFVSNQPDLAAALDPVPEAPLAAKYFGWIRIGLVALVAVGAALLFWPIALVLVVVLRIHELLNLADNRRPTDDHIAMLESDEDHGVHNQLSAVGLVQRGWFRGRLIRLGLWILQLGSKYLFNNGKLAEIDTIHFARWVMLDDGARVYFFSNFDGSPESYQDDFIERVAFGLNLVFSNGAGWPRTRYLLFKGASDEQSLKSYYRDHQLPTNVWFQADAYRNLTAVNMANNAAIRRGLSANLTDTELHTWLQRF